MKLCWLAVLLLLAATLSAIAKRRGQTSMTAPFEAGKEASKPRQPGPEMQKLFDAFLGTWTVTEQIQPSETMPNGAG
ncbi:MAG: hypothetical protein DME86_09955 [Verrucomicrobia bacterium]|nr:MAG: hypothetical protein DME86_09955 [Verrucomicrobiota bacterium]